MLTSTESTSVALEPNIRPQSQSVVGQDMNLFVFDAFEFDDSNTTDSPVLKLKDPWSFETSNIIQGELDKFSEYLENTMIEQKVNQEENEWALSQIYVGQNEIDIRVVATEEDSELYSQAFINLGADIYSGSEITISADKVTLDGTININDTLTVVDGEVQIVGTLALGTKTANDNFVINADGSFTAEAGIISGDLKMTENGQIIAFDTDVDYIAIKPDEIELVGSYEEVSGVIYYASSYIRGLSDTRSVGLLELESDIISLDTNGTGVNKGVLIENTLNVGYDKDNLLWGLDNIQMQIEKGFQSGGYCYTGLSGTTPTNDGELYDYLLNIPGLVSGRWMPIAMATSSTSIPRAFIMRWTSSASAITLYRVDQNQTFTINSGDTSDDVVYNYAYY